jgi:predicted GIY-YIG superfamily endonuclease
MAWVYIMANRYRTVLYVGVTNDLTRRAAEHKHHAVPGFTDRYNVTRLVFAEEAPDIGAAVTRERQLKGWRREKKVRLIESANPGWADLAAELGDG